MSLNKFYRLCAFHMNRCGLKGWKIRIAVIPKQTTLAYCEYETKSLVFSNTHILYSDMKDVEDTIIHEIGHVLHPPKAYWDNGHEGDWLVFAKREGLK